MISQVRQRIPELDGLRGLAIALVLVYHYVDFSGKSRILHYVLLPSTLGWSGVDLFFVLSGFLIGGILLDHRGAENYFKAFYARRIHRIFPIYYLMVALLVAGRFVFPTSELFRGSIPVWAFPLFAQNLLGDFTVAPPWIGVTWSLAVEEQFYLLVPMLVRRVSLKTLSLVLAGCIAGAPILRTILVLRGYGFKFVYAFFFCRIDALCLGIVAALLIRSEVAKAWIVAHRRSLYVTLLGFVLSMATLLKWTTYRYVGTIGYSMIAGMYFLLLVLLLVVPKPVILRFFTMAWLMWLGSVSYCVYLIHEPVRYAVFAMFGMKEANASTFDNLLLTSLALAITLGIAQLSWIVLEKRLIQHAQKRYQYGTTQTSPIPLSPTIEVAEVN